MTDRALLPIDKAYYQADMSIYYRDFAVPMIAFFLGFAWYLNASGAVAALPIIICGFAIHKAGAFVHEITHRQRDPAMKPFTLLWNLTIGAIVFMPAARFFKPHLIHHSTGIFGTRDDPQYLELRHDPKMMAFVLFGAPFLMPILNFIMMCTASLGMNFEEGFERLLRRHGHTMGSDVEPRYRDQVSWLSRYYLALFVIYAAILPETIPAMYAIHVIGWMLVTLRIPLEHEMERHHPQTTTARDHMLDSYTVEAPLAAILQPLGLQYHTAHHIHPGVPYHKLKALHYELKSRGDAEYNRRTVSFRDAVRGPKPAGRRADSQSHRDPGSPVSPC